MGEFLSKQRTSVGGVELFAGKPEKVEDKEIDRLLAAGNGHGHGLVKSGHLQVRRGDPSSATTPEEKAVNAAREAAAATKSELLAKARVAELEAALEAEMTAHEKTKATLASRDGELVEAKGALEALRASSSPSSSEPTKGKSKG